MKKRHLRPSIKLGLKIIFFCLVIFFGFKFVLFHFIDFSQSINANALKYHSQNCIAFYPKERGEQGYQYVENLCANAEISEETIVLDYQIQPLGDYLNISYGNNHAYLVNDDYSDIQIDELNDDAKMMISDYLRYDLKAKDLDEAYTSKFAEDTYYPNIKLDDFDQYYFDYENLYLHSNTYQTLIQIPLKYIGPAIGVSGVVETQPYVRKTFVNPNRKAVAITFDDGPSLKPECTDTALNELYKYDGCGTFYVVGSRLYDKTEPIIAKGIALGNEYGSHSCSHRNLKKLDDQEIYDEIYDVVTWFKDNFNYDVKTYRPPYGAYNDRVDHIVVLPAVLWNVDSLDWQLKDPDAIYNEIMGNVDNLDIILIHDIHTASVETLSQKDLIKNLVDQGYQVVTIEEIAKMRGDTLQQGTHLGWD